MEAALPHPATAKLPSTSTGSTANEDRALVRALLRSKVYREFQRAFDEATGLPVTLHPAGPPALSHPKSRAQSPFCALVFHRKDGCASCLSMNERLTRAALQQPATLDCAFGLSETAVPVLLGERAIGFLQVGRVFRTRPTSNRFDRAVRHLTTPSLNGAMRRFRAAYFKTPVFSEHKYRSLVKMLEIYARHLAALANQIATRQSRGEPPIVARAREHIQAHHTEKLTLGTVARAVGASSFHFCKIFKKTTGLNFTRYLARIRIETARNLLLDPQIRVSEAAFQSGFQSLAHFNRVFRRIVGESPTAYRAHLHAREPS